MKNATIHCRTAIRTHRDTRGDDRCWLDDYFVWNLIEGTPTVPAGEPPFDEGMDICRTYFKFRNATVPDPTPPDAVTDPTQWDNDLNNMNEQQLAAELTRLKNAIRAHRDIAGRPRTADDDRTLYAVLPEKIPCDFRLPPEADFLGEAKVPHAGCPSFWRSHAACPAPCHDFTRWGPCGKK